MTPTALALKLSEILAEHKAEEIVSLDVGGLTAMTDFMVIATGGSGRHVRALADHVIEAARQSGVRPLGVEGFETGDWVLVDLVDVVVHLMTAPARAFYRLEDIWTERARHGAAAGAA